MLFIMGNGKTVGLRLTKPKYMLILMSIRDGAIGVAVQRGGLGPMPPNRGGKKFTTVLAV